MSRCSLIGKTHQKIRSRACSQMWTTDTQHQLEGTHRLKAHGELAVVKPWLFVFFVKIKIKRALFRFITFKALGTDFCLLIIKKKASEAEELHGRPLRTDLFYIYTRSTKYWNLFLSTTFRRTRNPGCTSPRHLFQRLDSIQSSVIHFLFNTHCSVCIWCLTKW